MASLHELLGEPASEILSMWQRSTNRRVEVVGAVELPGGRSGATVLPVRIHDRGQVWGAILKQCPPSADGPAREPGAHDLALQLSPPTFVAEHLVERLFDPIALPGGGSLMFQRIANGSLADHVALNGLHRQAGLGATCRVVVRSILGDWNGPGAGMPTEVKAVSPGQYLSTLLDYRLEPTRPLGSWLRREPAIWSARSLYLVHPSVEESLVNPAALLLEHPAVTDLRVPMTVGLAHGDLHGENVIVPRAADVGHSFRLIDLATFRGDAPLTRDPLHLLLSFVERYLPELGPSGRRDLAAALVDEVPRPGLPAALAGAVEGVRQGGIDWYGSFDRGDDWRIERLLALAACALMFVPRDHGGNADGAWWYFRLAAMAVTRFVLEMAENPPLPSVRAAGHDGQREVRVNDARRERSIELSAEDRRRLAKAIMDVPYLRDHAHLGRLIKDLPSNVSRAVAHDGNDNLQDRALDLVTVVDELSDASVWRELVAAVSFRAGETPPVRRLTEPLDQLGCLLQPE